VSRTFRDAVLGLARRYPFARRLVNSGRLSVPCVHLDSPLNTSDRPGESFEGAMVPGAPAADAPVTGPHAQWLLGYLGQGFALLVFGDGVPEKDEDALAAAAISCRVLRVGGRRGIADPMGLLTRRYDGKPGTCYLFRPDQMVCARWRSFDAGAVRAALARASTGEQLP